MLNVIWVPSEVPAWAVCVVNEEAGIADEVVVIFVDGLPEHRFRLLEVRRSSKQER